MVFSTALAVKPGLRRRTGEGRRDVIARGLLGLGRGVRSDGLGRRRASPGCATMLVRTQIELKRPGLGGLRVRPDAGDLQQSQRIHFRRETDGHGPAGPASAPSAVRMIVSSGGSMWNASGSQGRMSPDSAAVMPRRGTGPKAHQLVGSELETRKVDFERLLG